MQAGLQHSQFLKSRRNDVFSQNKEKRSEPFTFFNGRSHFLSLFSLFCYAQAIKFKLQGIELIRELIERIRRFPALLEDDSIS